MEGLKELVIQEISGRELKGLNLSAWTNASGEDRLAVQVWRAEEGVLGGVTLSKESQRKLYEFLGKVLGEEKPE